MMKRARSGITENEDLRSVQRVLSLSDQDFARWLDRVIGAGLTTAKSGKTDG